jgi:hypothetical protein
MSHPLVEQLRFTRGEFRRGLEGLSPEDACRRHLPMNCISWNVGHLAWHEQRSFLLIAQGRKPRPDVHESFRYGGPASTPPLAEVLTAWTEITAAADPWLDALTTDLLVQRVPRPDGTPSDRTWGSTLQRVIYHYWYHTGENLAIRQVLGHAGLPEFVGDLDGVAPYRPS